MLSPLGLEKLLSAKFAKIESRQDVLQTTFSVFLDIFYPHFLPILRKMDFFNTQAYLQQEEWTKDASAPISLRQDKSMIDL